MSIPRSASRACMALLLLLLHAPAHSAGQPPAAAASCLACHGAQGEGMTAAGYPRLAGLPAQYISDQLNAYIDGRRVNAIMSGMAKPLSAAQIQAVADYFSALRPHTTPGSPPTDAAQARLGQQIAMHGVWEASIPACFSCHAADGSGIPPAFPPIVGQPAAYVEAQIKAWQNGTRQGKPDDLANNLMHSVSTRMTEPQIKAVAAWLAALPSTGVSSDTPIKP